MSLDPLALYYSVSPSIPETGWPPCCHSRPENHCDYVCTALVQVLEALYGSYSGSGTNTVITLVSHPQETTD